MPSQFANPASVIWLPHTCSIVRPLKLLKLLTQSRVAVSGSIARGLLANKRHLTYTH